MNKFYETDSQNVEFVTNIFKRAFTTDGIPFKVFSIEKQSEIIKCKKSSDEAEFIAKKEPMLQIIVMEDAFNRLDEKTKEFVVRKGLQGVSYNLENGQIRINNDLVANICELRHLPMYANANDFLNMLESEKACIQQVVEEKKKQAKEAKEAKGKKPQA